MIRGKPHWLWRSVDQDGYILDEILQTRRNTKAARRLLTRLLKRQRVRPGRMITDKLKSYGAAKCNLGFSIRHPSHKGLNNRAENSYLPLGNANASCRSSVHRASVSVSSLSSQPSEISSSLPLASPPLFRATSIGSAPSLSGAAQPLSAPEYPFHGLRLTPVS